MENIKSLLEHPEKGILTDSSKQRETALMAIFGNISWWQQAEGKAWRFTKQEP